MSDSRDRMLADIARALRECFPERAEAMVRSTEALMKAGGHLVRIVGANTPGQFRVEIDGIDVSKITCGLGLRLAPSRPPRLLVEFFSVNEEGWIAAAGGEVPRHTAEVEPVALEVLLDEAARHNLASERAHAAAVVQRVEALLPELHEMVCYGADSHHRLCLAMRGALWPGTGAPGSGV